MVICTRHQPTHRENWGWEVIVGVSGGVGMVGTGREAVMGDAARKGRMPADMCCCAEGKMARGLGEYVRAVV